MGKKLATIKKEMDEVDAKRRKLVAEYESLLQEKYNLVGECFCKVFSSYPEFDFLHMNKLEIRNFMITLQKAYANIPEYERWFGESDEQQFEATYHD